MDGLQHHLANTLKAQRTERGWSLSQAAEKTGVSKAMLGQIERAESSPTIATLWKIATGFNLPFSLFLVAQTASTDASTGAPKHALSLPAFRQTNQTMQVQTLFPYNPSMGFEMLIVELAAGATSESAPHEQDVTEHIIVIEGELSLAINGFWQPLVTEEALRFKADCPHSYHNPGSQPVRFYNLIHYPNH